MAKARTKPIQWLLITVLALGFTQGFAQDWPAEPPAEAPADWGPVSLNLEEIEYPWPVHYLDLPIRPENAYGLYGYPANGISQWSDHILATRS